MTQPVIDTLKLADSLKESGFPDRQAEGLARALGRALTEHVVTKGDLDAAIRLVRADIVALDNRVSSLEAKIDAIDGRFDTIDGKFEARFNSLSTQIKFIFAMLAALLALGLIDTVVPMVA